MEEVTSAGGTDLTSCSKTDCRWVGGKVRTRRFCTQGRETDIAKVRVCGVKFASSRRPRVVEPCHRGRR